MTERRKDGKPRLKLTTMPKPKTPDIPTSWDLWCYRENGGWWLDDTDFYLSDAKYRIEKLLSQNDANVTKFQFCLTPHGVPMAAPNKNR